MQPSISFIVSQALEGHQNLMCNICLQQYKDTGVPMNICANNHWTCNRCAQQLARLAKPCPFCRLPVITPLREVKLNRQFFIKMNESIEAIKQNIKQKYQIPNRSEPINSIVPSSANNDHTFLKCPKGHYLQPCLIKKSYWVKQTHFCNVCKLKLIGRTNIFWNCSRCDYDICFDCSGFGLSTCPFGHPLQAPNNFTAQNNKFCDICDTKNIKAALNCLCNFDICINCVEKMKHKK